MNHLGDTNKMVSDTPRTDSLLTAILDSDGFVHNGNCPQRWVNHARELERELNAANQRIKQLEEMYEGVIGERPEFLGSNVMGLLKRELTGTQKRIKRMEEVGDEMARWLSSSRNLGDDPFLSHKWYKAKEAKP